MNPENGAGATTQESSRETLTTEEVAELLRVHEQTVRKLAEAGEIPGAFRLGGQWRFNRTRLLEMMNA